MFSPEYYREQAKIDGPISRAHLLIHFIVSGMPSGLAPGPMFDAAHYMNTIQDLGVSFDTKSTTPFEHWLSYGVKNKISPSSFYNDHDYLKLNADLATYPGWLFEHFICHGINEGRQFVKSMRVESGYTTTLFHPRNTGAHRFYKRIAQSADVNGMKTSLTRVSDFPDTDIVKDIFSRASAIDPEIGLLDWYTNLTLVPPYHDQAYLDFQSIREILENQTFDNVILMPFCKLGGADYVGGLLARSLVASGRTLILRTEQSDWARPDWFPDAATSIDLSVYLNALPETRRVRVLYEILRASGAENIINVNSRTGFLLFERFGKQLSYDKRLHAYYFCADRDKDGMEVGYPIWFFSNILPYLTSAITDNDHLRGQLCERYCLTDELAARVHAVYTPTMSAVSAEPVVADGIASREQPRKPLLLWGGRLDRQKRFDLVLQIADLMPDIQFACWGKAVLDQAPDLSRMPDNVVLHPPFKHLSDLPVEEADGWLYTSDWDGLPTILIECAAVGMPIVASAVGGVPELIDDETGWPVRASLEATAYVRAIREMLSQGEERMIRARALQDRIRTRHQFTTYQDRVSSIIVGLSDV
jgi:glycosyltransferase involved in cell wall biosynthesis